MTRTASECRHGESRQALGGIRHSTTLGASKVPPHITSFAPLWLSVLARCKVCEEGGWEVARLTGCFHTIQRPLSPGVRWFWIWLTPRTAGTELPAARGL